MNVTSVELFFITDTCFWCLNLTTCIISEPDFVLCICRVEDGQRVAIGDTNNPAGDFVGERIIDKQYEQKCKDLPFHN